MKRLLCIIFSAFSQFLIAQTNYFDSLEISIKNLSPFQQQSVLVSLPYDKIVGNTSRAEKLFLNALKVAKQINNKEYEADIYNQLALIYSYQGKQDISLNYNLKAINIYELIENKSKAGTTYGLLGFSMYTRDIVRAKLYMLKGIKLLETNNDLVALNPLYDNYGIVQEVSGNIDSAIYYYNLALKLKRNQRDSVGIPFALGHLSGVYLLKKEYKHSKIYLDESYGIRKKRNDTYGIAECTVLYGDFYYAQQHFKEASVWFLESYNMALKNKYIHLAQYASQHLSSCYENLGNMLEAINYLKIQQLLKDSMINEKTNNAFAKYEIQFDSEKKEKQILEQKAKISEQELKSRIRTNQIVMLSALLLVLLITSFFVYKQQKFKQQKLIEENRLMEQLAKIELQNELQQERLRISSDLHDNIGSQLTFIISSIDNIQYLFKNTNDQLNHKLVNISTFTHNTITQLRDTIWALNKDEINFDDLKERLNNYLNQAKSAQEKIKFETINTHTNNYKLNALQGVNIYRIVQESINNSIKYSAATTISLVFTETNNELKIAVIDDGIGFVLNKITLGNGLQNIKNRALKINAYLTINSTPEKGTSITLIIKKDTINAV